MSLGNQILKKPIFTSLAPNIEDDDKILAFRILFSPDKWKEGKRIREFEKALKKYLGVKFVVSFNSGRSAFLSILKSLPFKKEDEILLQAFTCNAAVNPIIWANLKPVFVDCDQSFNIDPQDLEKKITSKSKAVVVQHTFGQPANMEEIKKIAKKNNLFLIEDCAHSLGAEYKGKKIGTLGDISFFSFSRDKIISSVYGGAIATNNENFYRKIKKYQEKLEYPSYLWIFQQLLYLFLAPSVLQLYRIPSLGKRALQFFHLTKILSKAVQREEKKGKKPSFFPQKFPNALANLALKQLNKLEKFNLHREKIARFYLKNFQKEKLKITFQSSHPFSKRVYMRFPIIVQGKKTSNEILKRARRERIFLNDGWRETPIVPPDTNQEKMQYLFGTCKKAEDIAKKIINLPTHINISEKDAERIIRVLKKILRE